MKKEGKTRDQKKAGLGIGRREFLKKAALGASAVGIASITAPEKIVAAVSESAENNGGKQRRNLAMLIDLRKCVGCSSCATACKSENGVPLGVFRSWVKIVEKGTYPNVSSHFLPRLCQHCEDAPCLRNCPTNATYKNDDGLILINEDRCMTCGMCVSSCPYRARFINPETEVADKCTFCAHKVMRGELPACVDACPYGARIFGDLNDSNSEIRKIMDTEPVQVLSPERGTKPKVFYIALNRSTAETMGGKYEELG